MLNRVQVCYRSGCPDVVQKQVGSGVRTGPMDSDVTQIDQIVHPRFFRATGGWHRCVGLPVRGVVGLWRGGLRVRKVRAERIPHRQENERFRSVWRQLMLRGRCSRNRSFRYACEATGARSCKVLWIPRTTSPMTQRRSGADIGAYALKRVVSC